MPFLLQHSYATDDCEETKTIGIFSSNEKAQEAVEILKIQNGFKKFPDCFFIDEYDLDKFSWQDGFYSQNFDNHKFIRKRWAKELAERLSRSEEAIIDNELTALDFPRSQVIIENEGAVTYIYERAFYLLNKEKTKVAVFSEHAGYHEYHLYDGMTVKQNKI